MHHYTFHTLLSIPGTSEEHAKMELNELLSQLVNNLQISGHGIRGVASDLTYNEDGNPKVPV